MMLEAPTFPARVSLVDGTGQPLVQSDGSAAGAGDGWIDVNVPAGNDFLEVQSLGAGGTYQITADLTPTNPAFQPVSSQSSGYFPIAVGDLNGSKGLKTLSLPMGSTWASATARSSTVVDGPLGESGWSVTAITVGDFDQSGLPDIAFAETNPDGCAKVCDASE